MTASSDKSSRLASLDILRGLDLFLLLFLQPVIWAVASAAQSDAAWVQAVMHHLDHEVWIGFRLWDLVMPLFLFMVGTSMPFALSKYIGATDRRPAYRRIARRFLLLFILGMVVQGNLLALDPHRLLIYNNTLQSIAVGYLFAALMLLNLSTRQQVAVTAALLVIYSAGMALGGDYSPEGNFAFAVDRAVIGPFRGDLTYTWIWSSLTFTVTVMMGAFAGKIIRRRTRATGTLSAIGLGCIAAGLLLSAIGEPIIKRLWTSSMTLYAGGWCFLLMALFYWWIDVRGHSRGLGWLKIYGMNPITAYVVGEVINFRSIVDSLSFGLEPWLGLFYPAWLTFGNALILFLLLAYMYRARIFLKV